MGQTADAIEFDLERQRHALTARVARFKRRVGDDVGTARARTSEHVSGVKHAVASTGENAAHKVGSVAGATTGSGTAIAGHPKSLLAGAAVGGIALGLATGSSEEGKTRSRQSTRKDRPSGGLIGSLTGAARVFASAQTSRLMEAAMTSAKSSLKTAVSGKQPPGDGPQQEGEAHVVRAARPAQLRGPQPVPSPAQSGSNEARGAALDPFTP